MKIGVRKNLNSVLENSFHTWGHPRRTFLILTKGGFDMLRADKDTDIKLISEKLNIVNFNYANGCIYLKPDFQIFLAILFQY